MPNGISQLQRLAAAHPLHLEINVCYFLCHAQTTPNALKVYPRIDEPLNAKGETQAQRVEQRLGNEFIRSIVCSDALRAQRTAQIVAHPHRVLPHVDAQLSERNFGALIGTSAAHIDWLKTPANGESLEDFVRRCRSGIARALQHQAPTLIVAHTGTLYVLAALLGVSLNEVQLELAQPLQFTRDSPEQAWQVNALIPNSIAF